MALDTTITKSSMYSSIHNLVFQTLNSNVTNPHSSGKWIFSSFPLDEISNDDFPIVVIPTVSISHEYVTAGDKRRVLVPITIEIEVHSISGTQLDSVSDDIMNVLDTKQDTLLDGGLSIIGFEPSRLDERWLDDAIRVHIKTIIVKGQFDFVSSGT